MDETVKQPIPWQNRKELGLIKAFWQTARQVLFRPGDFFNNLETKGPYPELFFFYFINFVFLWIITTLYNVLFSRGDAVLQLLVFFLLSPFLIFISVGVMHLWILLFRGKGGFKDTFNVLAYSSITNIFNIIPFIGGLLGGVWGTIIWVMGFKRVHKFGTLRAILVCILNPFVLLVIALLAAIIIPNLARARIERNELAAQATLNTLYSDFENYAAKNNGQYPSGLDRIINQKVGQGYDYSLKMKPGGYEITATPSRCGITGERVFIIEEKGKLSEMPCK